jgi:hypothetical protein
MTKYVPTSELRVIKGEPTAEELAAIVVVLRHQAHHQDEVDRVKPEWNAPHRNVRWHFEHGPAMWRRSALPH